MKLSDLYSKPQRGMPFAHINLSLSITPHWWNRNNYPFFSSLPLLPIFFLLEIFLPHPSLFTSWLAGESGGDSDDEFSNGFHLLCSLHVIPIFPLQSSNKLRMRTLLSQFLHKETENEKTKETTKEMKLVVVDISKGHTFTKLHHVF